MATWIQPSDKVQWEESFKKQFNRIIESCGVTKSQIAHASKIDPSYATMFSAKGRLPTRKVMHALGYGLELLKVPQKEIYALWLSAGLLPKKVNEQFIDDLSRAMSLEEGEEYELNIDDVEEDSVSFSVYDED